MLHIMNHNIPNCIVTYDACKCSMHMSHTHTHIHTYIHTHAYIYIYIYACMYGSPPKDLPFQGLAIFINNCNSSI